ncbi:MAG TPA: hypothetical protein VM051_06825 [Usitatibacter sp.]|nr:hypothetical protein [Usitatibacter sp.]
MRRLAALALAGIIAGCATGGPPPFPDPRDAVVRVVLAPAPEAGEYRIPGSHVFISGSVVSSGLGSREGALSQRFDDIITQRLRESRIGHAATVWPARVLLIPKARLAREADGAALLCTLEAQYSVGGMADDFVHRTYSYRAPRPKPLVAGGEGWTDREGEAFEAATHIAFEKLADAFVADWQGRLAPGKALDLGDFVAIDVSGASSRKSIVVKERSALAP